MREFTRRPALVLSELRHRSEAWFAAMADKLISLLKDIEEDLDAINHDLRLGSRLDLRADDLVQRCSHAITSLKAAHIAYFEEPPPVSTISCPLKHAKCRYNR